MHNDRFAFGLWSRACFDPLSLTAATVAGSGMAAMGGGAAAAGGAAGIGTAGAVATGATGIGAAIGALGTILGGGASKTAAYYQAAQLNQNAVTARAQAQRGSMEDQQRARMAQSSAIARAAAGGVAVTGATPSSIVGGIAGRGEYQAMTEMARGENAARGMEAEASGLRYSGDAAQSAAYLSAAGTIAGGAGSMFSTYGRFKYPYVGGGYGGGY